MIAIVNIDADLRETGEHKYEIRINREPIATFTHKREEPLFVCLAKAALAAWKASGKEEFAAACGDRPEQGPLCQAVNPVMGAAAFFK
jgi:hypothetical protein